MSGRRGLLVVLATCIGAGAIVLIAAGRVWRRADLVAATGQHVAVHVTGHAAEPALPALGIALVVMAGAVLAARGWLRRVVGLVAVAIGGAVVALAVAARTDAADELRHQAFAVSHAVVAESLSAWAIVTIVAGVAAVVAGSVTVVLGTGWPSMGARYDAPAARRTEDLAGDWEAQDRGEDPTV
jgi:hypothetical protein